MPWILIKYLLTAAVVVAVSEIAKRSDRAGGFIAALPLITLLSLIWLHVEHQSTAKIANHAWYTFWYVLPTLPMFLAFPALLPRLGFWPTMLACVGITVICFGVFAHGSAKDRVWYGMKTFLQFVGISLVIAWILYFIP